MLKKMMRSAEKAAFAEGYITISGGREVRVENCLRVYECNEIMTRLKTRDGTVTVWGEGLTTSSYYETTVTVSGKIRSVEFEDQRSAGKDD